MKENAPCPLQSICTPDCDCPLHPWIREGKIAPEPMSFIEAKVEAYAFSEKVRRRRIIQYVRLRRNDLGL